MAKKITWWQAAEILGISDRHMRRIREPSPQLLLTIRIEQSYVHPTAEHKRAAMMRYNEILRASLFVHLRARKCSFFAHWSRFEKAD
jgi:hypothetical protein